MKGFNKVLVAITLLNLVALIRTDFVCDISNINVPHTGKYPTLPDVFENRVEISYVNEKKSATTYWHYDYNKRKACVEVKEDSYITKLIFNYETDELFELTAVDNAPSEIEPSEGEPLYPTSCVTKKLSDYKTDSLYDFGSMKVGDLLYPKQSRDIFQYYTGVYNGTKDINGLETDMFLDCHTDSNSNYLITYYFSTNKDEVPDGKQIPIRANFKGEMTVNNNKVPFEIELNFYDFQSKVSDYTIFQTPSTVFCSDRKKTDSFPKIGNVFGYSEEIISQKYNFLYLKNLNFDYNKKLIRYEIRSEQKTPTNYYQNSPLLFVTDYNVGIQYVFNKVKGNCSIRGVRDFDDLAEDVDFEQEQGSPLGFITKMKTPESFLNLNADYAKTGSRTVNGILSDKYIAELKLYGTDSLIEYSFSNPNVSVSNEESTETNVLVSMNIQTENQQTRSNYFDFARTKPSLSLFDIGKCFDNKDKHQIRLTLPISDYDIDQKIISNQFNLEGRIIEELQRQTGEFSLRFSEPFITQDDEDNLYIYLTIFPRPPILEMFTPSINAFILGSSYILENFYDSDVEECAYHCIENLQCLSFDFAKYAKTCYLNSVHYKNVSAIPTPNFLHYSRNTLEATVVREPFQIYNGIEGLIRNKSISIDFILDVDGTSKTVPFSKIEKVSSVNRFGSTSLLKNYKLKHKDYKFSTYVDKTFFDITIDECANKCNELSGAECKLFNFCFLSGECKLSSSNNISLDNNGIVSAKHWDIYEKDDLYHYNSPVSTLENPKDFKLSAVATAADCAARCDGAKNLHCKSFNFCERKNLCYLSESHMLETIEKPDYHSECEHYSRKFLYDFKYTNSEELSLDAEVVLNDLSLDECSKECVTADGLLCKSFDYCKTESGPKTCLINSGNKKISENSIPLKFGDCAHYQREYFFDTNLVNNILIKGKVENDNSSDVLTAMIVLFLIIGIFSGIIVTIILSKKNMLK